MSSVTLQILDGHERGTIYKNLATPVTIGREEENSIRLNDERVSRFHAKIQEDDGRIILTDLESTNGTRVNGHAVSMRVLQLGDQILIGRSLLSYGTARQIEGNGAALTESGTVPASAATLEADSVDEFAVDDDDDETAYRPGVDGAFPGGPPPLPGSLSPAQRAEISDLLSFVHQQLLAVSMTSYTGDDPAHGEHTVVPHAGWQQLVALQGHLADYLRDASAPE